MFLGTQPRTHAVQDWLGHLRCLLPVTGVVYVGAGDGAVASARCAAWDAPLALFVEADEGLCGKLAAASQGRPGWSCHAALLGEHSGTQDFYVASNPGESGVLPPESLAGLWRNLKTVECRRLDTTPLEVLLAVSGHAPHAFNWAVIDCLPALPVIRGAGRCLDAWDVVIARAILDEGLLPGRGATKPELDAYLVTRGFRCVACQEERQPAVGSAVYVRDWKALRGGQLAESPEPVRTVHHLSCTGGTLITKCLAAMPAVMVLNEVDPLSTMARPEGQSTFAPTDMISLVRQGDPNAPDSLLSQLFLQNLGFLRDELGAAGKRLVVRDHSHSHFLTGDRIPDRPSLLAIVKSHFPTLSIVTVRDPVDSFLSLRLLKFGWKPIVPATFDEYCRRYLAFLDAYADVPVFRYEDFVREPLPEMRRICQALDLSFSERFVDNFSGFRFSGDSGRKGDVIAPRERRDTDDAFMQAAGSSIHYKTLIRRLGYDDCSGLAKHAPRQATTMQAKTKPHPTKYNVLQRIKECGIPVNEIVDVGVRERTLELLREFPDKRHHLFEPANIFFQEIHQNYSQLDYKLYPLALSNENRDMYLVVSSLKQDGVSTHSQIRDVPTDVDGKKIVSCTPLRVSRFDSLDTEITKDFLLKVDVDGKDLEVLKGFGDKIRLASIVIVEATFLTLGELVMYITGAGFQLFDIVDIIYYGPGFFQCDIVFLREDLLNSDIRPSIKEYNGDLWVPIR